MAPSHSRQLLAWSLPTIAVLLSYLWFKRKRLGAQSDPGGAKVDRQVEVEPNKPTEPIDVKEETQPAPAATSPSDKKISRSLSGVETEPIDIIIPREMRSVKSNPIHISDEELDQHIEKVKSMKNTTKDIFTISKELEKPVEASPQKTPVKEKPVEEAPVKKTENKPVNGAKNERKKNAANKPDREVKTPQAKSQVNGTLGKKGKKAQKAVKVEEKLTALKINAEEIGRKDKEEAKGENAGPEHDLQRQSSERDSANHSPVDVMLASPSLSSISDNHSEGSSDSGKGGSEVATPPSRTPAVSDMPEEGPLERTVYDFIIPQLYVGKLIGRGGSTVNDIKTKSNTHIIVKAHPNNRKVKLCVIEGTTADIDKALKLIRERFPMKRYPDVTLEQCFLAIPAIQLNPEALYLRLVEGIDNDTVLSCIVKPNHLFLQQPTHPTFMSLTGLNYTMNMDYSSPTAPRLQGPIPESSVCAALSVNQWYRVLVLGNYPEQNQVYVTFLDYGGYAYVDYNDLRQIRPEYLNLPFQAQGCVLAGIKSASDDDEWPAEAYNLVTEITSGHMLCTQIDGFTEFGEPLIHVYALIPNKKAVYLNKELVDRGYAEWNPQLWFNPTTDEVISVEGPVNCRVSAGTRMEECEGAVGGVA